MRKAATREKGSEIPFRRIGDDGNRGLRIQEQPRLRVSLVTIAHDDDPLAGDPEKGRKYGKLFGLSMHHKVRFQFAALSPNRDGN